MTKKDLIKKVQQSLPDCLSKDLACAVNAILNSMFGALTTNEKIEIRGLGSFTVRSRSAHDGRNPKSGKIFSVPHRKALHFKASKELQRSINGLP